VARVQSDGRYDGCDKDSERSKRHVAMGQRKAETKQYRMRHASKRHLTCTHAEKLWYRDWALYDDKCGAQPAH
jgi:hypothetical protein